MPRLIEVDNVCRFSVLQHWSNGRHVANIIDMEITGVGAGTTRADALKDQAEIISDAWVTHMLSHVADNLVMDGVRWLDLDPSFAGTGIDVSDAGATGANSNAAAAPAAAYLIHKNLVGAPRGKRNGRWYWAGVTEPQVDENGLVTLAINSDLAAMKGDINQDAGVVFPIYNSRMCVLHLDAIDPTNPDQVIGGTLTHVDSLTIDAKQATQRRRLR
jgi:hypothetical protein